MSRLFRCKGNNDNHQSETDSYIVLLLSCLFPRISDKQSAHHHMPEGLHAFCKTAHNLPSGFQNDDIHYDSDGVRYPES